MLLLQLVLLPVLFEREWANSIEGSEIFVEGKEVSEVVTSAPRSQERLNQASDTRGVSYSNSANQAPRIRTFTPEEMCAGFGGINPSDVGLITGPSQGYLTGPAAEFCATWTPAAPPDPANPDAPPVVPARPSDEVIIAVISDNASALVDPGEISIEPNRMEVLVNKDVYLASSATQYTDTLDVLGVPVRLTLTPTSYAWSLGDGTAFNTETPGGPWPDGGASAPYLNPGTYSPSVSITWAIDLSIDGGDWQRLATPAQTTSSAPALTVIEMESVLTRERK